MSNANIETSLLCTMVSKCTAVCAHATIDPVRLYSYKYIQSIQLIGKILP